MITPMDHNICRVYMCDTPVGESSYLCGQHIVELQKALDQIPGYLIELAPLDLATRPGTPGQGGGSATGSRPPLNLHAWAVWIELHNLPTRASDVAHHDPNAGHTYKRAITLAEQAHQILNGPEEPTVDRMAAARRIHIDFPLPMTGKEIREAFAKWGVHITRQQMYNWVDRGHLKSVGTAEDGKSQLFTVLAILTALQRTHPTPHHERSPHPIAS